VHRSREGTKSKVSDSGTPFRSVRGESALKGQTLIEEDRGTEGRGDEAGWIANSERPLARESVRFETNKREKKRIGKWN